jgi:ABC-type lipoprotein release transport system permease subunit
MTTLRLICKEIFHRKFNFLLSLLAVVTAVVLFVSSITTGQAAHRETKKLMLGTGLNLRVISKDTDMNKFWHTRFSEHTMPQEYIERLASHKEFTVNHLLATLTKRILWRNKEILLTGIAPEVYPPGKEKPSISFEIEPGTIYVGYQIARDLGFKKGEEVDILGKKFTVARCLYETGTPEGDDIRVQCHLQDAQEILNLPGQVNEIKAIDCMCVAAGGESQEDTLARLRTELTKLLPDIKVFQWKKIAEMRHNQRIMIQRYFTSIILPSAVVVCLVWLGVAAMMNVRERRMEIGLMRALGYCSGKVAALFLGKSLIIGFIGAALGFIIGTDLALRFGPDIFTETARAIKPMYNLLFWSLIAAPAFSALASLIPTMIAVTQDPAFTLREE